MGLFDLLKGKAKVSDVPGAVTPADKNVVRIARVAGDKHAQNYDRIEAIEALARIPSAESAAGLLRRFTFHIDPSITDQEEKDAALRGVLNAGEAAIEPIRAFCLKAESLTWPLKILRELLPTDGYRQELIQLLDRFDTEYVRNVDPKQQLIAELEQYPTRDARVAVERFLEDVNEVIRFVAVTTVFAQEDPLSVEPLVKALASDESVRVKNRISEGLASRRWVVPEAWRNDCSRALPSGYALNADGTVKQR
jgi:hypothetical protein